MKKLNTLQTIGLIGGGLLAGWTAWSLYAGASVKKPRYWVSSRKKNYELRQYNSYIVAEIDVTGTFGEALDKGFRALFEYISGANRKQSKIPMTAPVTEKIDMTVPVTGHEGAGSRHTIAFIMPPGSTLATLPRPVNPAIRLREVPARTVAALRFTGIPSAQRMEQKKNELLASLFADHIPRNAPPETAVYNPPYTIPFLRRDEILVEVGR